MSVSERGSCLEPRSFRFKNGNFWHSHVQNSIELWPKSDYPSPFPLETLSPSDQKLCCTMSTLKKNKRIKRAAQLELYGDLKPGRGNKKVERGKAKYLGGNGRKTTGITKRVYRQNLKKIQVVENGSVVTRRVPVKLIRSGAITKPVATDPFALPEHN